MSEYIVNGTALENIADAIRTKTGTTAGIRLNDMPDAIMGIESPPENETYLAETVCNKTALLDYAVLGERIQEITVKLDHEPDEDTMAQVSVTVGNLFNPQVINSYLQNGEFVFTQETEINFTLPQGKYYIGFEADAEETYPITVNYSTGLKRQISRSFSVSGYQELGCVTNGLSIKSITFQAGKYKNICIFAGDTVREYEAYRTPYVFTDYDEYEYNSPSPLFISDWEMTLDDTSILIETSERMYVKYYAYRDKKAYDVACDTTDTVYRHQFWDIFQECGNRTNYGSAFSTFWNSETFRPFYDIEPVSANYMFLRASIRDFSQLDADGVYIDFYNCTDCEGIFTRSEFVELPILDFSNAVNLYYTFSAASSLQKIQKMILNENTLFKDTFNACSSLREITIEGTIGQNGFNVSWSKNLTKNSLLSILNALKDSPDITSPTCTLGATNLAKLTQAEKNIAINKGWTLA
ncbi:MAG: hypothetical protein KBS52_07095 [Clostridiales bacterium]|nr:hypothetical protein [Candidatus Equinaster intestinalis]